MISLPDHAWLMRSLWIAFALIWGAGALMADRTVRRPSRAQYWPHLALMICGAALMLNVFGQIRLLQLQVWPGYALFPLGFVLTVIGLAIAIWARIHLGRYWSAAVGSKAEHRLIESGPYARLRHPIYTGATLAVLGSAIADGNVHAIFGAAILVVALIAKSRREEEWLAQEFGPAYGAYRARSWALVPFVY
jgi:protein-S-isoprenylcysteine O-methyltransferase Ste14